jgi:hypothetical protein
MSYKPIYKKLKAKIKNRAQSDCCKFILVLENHICLSKKNLTQELTLARGLAKSYQEASSCKTMIFARSSDLQDHTRSYKMKFWQDLARQSYKYLQVLQLARSSKIILQVLARSTVGKIKQDLAKCGKI